MYIVFRDLLLIYTESPGDYGGISKLLSFKACDTRQCVEVPIVSDNIGEDVEAFTAHLERTANLNPRITLDPNITRVVITGEGVQ